MSKTGLGKTTLALCIVCLLLPAQTRVSPKLNLKWIYVSKNLAWRSPPKDPELLQYQTSRADLAVFYPSGEFAEGNFEVGRYRGQSTIFLIPNEGYVIWKGKWTRGPGTQMTVRKRVVSSQMMVQPSKEPVPRSLKEEKWQLHGVLKGRLAATLRAPRGEYEPLPAISNIDSVSRIINP